MQSDSLSCCCRGELQWIVIGSWRKSWNILSPFCAWEMSERFIGLSTRSEHSTPCYFLSFITYRIYVLEKKKIWNVNNLIFPKHFRLVHLGVYHIVTFLPFFKKPCVQTTLCHENLIFLLKRLFTCSFFFSIQVWIWNWKCLLRCLFS